MSVSQRHKNVTWICSDQPGNENVVIQVQQDIRDALIEQNRLLSQLVYCHRVRGALDTIVEVGREIRRKQRAKRKKARGT